jgi:hypothetical protein
MLKTLRFFPFQRMIALAAGVSLAGCTNCAVPAFNAAPPPGGLNPTACTQNAVNGVPLGTAVTFAVLGGSTVTNTGTPTVVTGDLGVSPGAAITGFPPGQVVSGSKHSADPTAATAQSDATTAYNDAASRVIPVPVVKNGDIGGQTLTPGIYKASSSLGITGTVTLDGQNQVNPVFIFQIASALTTAPNSSVKLINGAGACNVIWQIGSSATLDTGTTFNGTILALASITLNTGAVLNGRALAQNGAVTMDNNLVVRP